VAASDNFNLRRYMQTYILYFRWQTSYAYERRTSLANELHFFRFRYKSTVTKGFIGETTHKNTALKVCTENFYNLLWQGNNYRRYQA
jgi:hypothetical protein